MMELANRCSEARQAALDAPSRKSNTDAARAEEAFHTSIDRVARLFKVRHLTLTILIRVAMFSGGARSVYSCLELLEASQPDSGFDEVHHGQNIPGERSNP